MPTALARLTILGKKFKDGSFPELYRLKNKMVQNGYSRSVIHVGYARAKGTYYCKSCEKQVINPESDWYQGVEFWKCTCNKINYINKSNQHENNYSNTSR